MTISHSFPARVTSRRSFLAGGIGAVVGVGVHSSSALGAPASARAKLRLGLATYNWGKDWDISTLIANCHKAGLDGVELRTSSKHAHGVEVTLNARERAAVKSRFADSPVRIVSIACSERMDWPEPERLAAAIEATKAHLELSRDLGCDVLRVFPNQFHPGVPHEQTVAQIARALNKLGAVAADLGQEVSLEAHGPAGELTTMRAIMDGVTQPSVRVRLNCDARDAKGAGFVANFNLVKDRLSRTIHIHDLHDPQYPYALMVELLVKAGWEGYALMEHGQPVADRVSAMIEQRKLWESLIDKAPS